MAKITIGKDDKEADAVLERASQQEREKEQKSLVFKTLSNLNSKTRNNTGTTFKQLLKALEGKISSE